MLSIFRPVFDALVSLAFPRMCDLCENQVDSLADGVTCSECWEKLWNLDRLARCPRCHYPLLGDCPSSTNSCRQCQEMRLDLLRFAGSYEGALRSNLLLLKVRPHLCRRMKELTLSKLKRERELLSADLLIPVPLHPLRLRERGYNQAEVIAKFIARTFDLQLERHFLVRVKHTDPHRAGMDSQERSRSVSGAFAVTDRERIKDKTILLVDDIYTTGATLNECARELKEAGARAVYGFTVARAISDALIGGS